MGTRLQLRALHVIGFPSLVDLWVIKIKKPMILCACSTSRSREQSTKNADHTARTCERFVYSVVKITRLYDYQTWQTRFWRNSRGAQRLMGLFFLDCAFRMLIDWAGKLRSHVWLLLCVTHSLMDKGTWETLNLQVRVRDIWGKTKWLPLFLKTKLDFWRLQSGLNKAYWYYCLPFLLI